MIVVQPPRPHAMPLPQPSPSERHAEHVLSVQMPVEHSASVKHGLPIGCEAVATHSVGIGWIGDGGVPSPHVSPDPHESPPLPLPSVQPTPLAEQHRAAALARVAAAAIGVGRTRGGDRNREPARPA